METKYAGVTRWRLRDDVAFIDADSLERKIEELPFPVLIDNIFEKDTSKRTVTWLDDITAFILGFIAMGVDTEKHLPDIILSEYEDMSLDRANKEINRTLELLNKMDYLVPRDKMPIPEAPGVSEVMANPVNKANYLLSIGPTLIKRAH